MMEKQEDQLLIREAKRSDVPSFINTISKAKTIGNCTHRDYLRWIVREGFAYVAENKKRPVGFLLAERNSKVGAHVNYVFVHRKYRGKGLGSNLMKTFLVTCKKKGVRYIDLNAKNTALGFYRNFGFKTEGKYAVLYKKLRAN